MPPVVFVLSKNLGRGKVVAQVKKQVDEQRPEFWVGKFSVVFNSNRALVEVFFSEVAGLARNEGHEAAGLTYVDGVEHCACAVDDIVVSEVINTDVRRLTMRSRRH